MLSKKTKDHKQEDIKVCPNCLKNLNLCVCTAIKKISCPIEVLILQHPQEPDKLLGTARIAHLSLDNSTLKIGLSWPNLNKALGKETDRSNWAVLYLGNKETTQKLKQKGQEIALLSAKEKFLENEQEILSKLKGIIILDGTWSQAKTIWWRNPWLTKLNRIILSPSRPSLYGKLRKEPRKESLSTIESIAWTLSFITNDSEIKEKLLFPFHELLNKYKHR
jgi:DTW domain-containing protein